MATPQDGQMATTDTTIVSGGMVENVSRVAYVLSEAFASDPTFTYIFNDMTKAQRLAFLPTFFQVLAKTACLNHGSLDGVGNWQSCGVILPPGCSVDRPLTWFQAGFLPVAWTMGFRGVKRMLSDVTPVTDACKAKFLKNEKKYYYVFFLGTLEGGRGRGYCSTMLRHYQAIAQRDGLPIWLEAATVYCRSLYEKLGFINVEELSIGVGKAAADGTRCKGGPGVKIWGMIWRPKVDSP